MGGAKPGETRPLYAEAAGARPAPPGGRRVPAVYSIRIVPSAGSVSISVVSAWNPCDGRGARYEIVYQEHMDFERFRSHGHQVLRLLSQRVLRENEGLRPKR